MFSLCFFFDFRSLVGSVRGTKYLSMKQRRGLFVRGIAQQCVHEGGAVIQKAGPHPRLSRSTEGESDLNQIPGLTVILPE